MKFLLLISISLLFLPLLQGQAQDCNCAEQFEFLYEKITINYSGYKDKVTSENQAAYEAYTTKYQELTNSATADSTCFRLLNEWSAWFKDGHIQLSELPPAPNEIRARYADWETINMTETEVKADLKSRTYHPVEGIWEDQSGNYRCAILRKEKENRVFAAFILKADSIWWMPGQVKYELTPTDQEGKFSIAYFMRNHSLREEEAVLEDYILNFKGIGSWRKVYPETAPKIEALTQPMYTLKKMDEQTLVLTVPTMDEGYRREMKALIKTNEQLLKSTPNLIIDCRDNGGGSDITYAPLRPFIYTNPLTSYYVQAYSTKDNNQKYVDLSKDKDYPWLYRQYFKRRAKKLEKRRGEYVGKTGKFTQKFKRKHDMPQNIAVLINDGCASSCEQFVLFAEQSSRVTLIGENTAGIKDYGNLHTLIFPCEKWRLHYPTTRWTSVDDGKGVDNIGIAPDVQLEEDTEDWVKFAWEYLLEKSKS